MPYRLLCLVRHGQYHNDVLTDDGSSLTALGHDSHEVLVCHGIILRCFVCCALAINVDTWGKLNIDHCGISAMRRLLTHNETGCLPPKQTSS